jgi:hypothetical protein
MYNIFNTIISNEILMQMVILFYRMKIIILIKYSLLIVS